MNVYSNKGSMVRYSSICLTVNTCLLSPTVKRSLRRQTWKPLHDLAHICLFSLSLAVPLNQPCVPGKPNCLQWLNIQCDFLAPFLLLVLIPLPPFAFHSPPCIPGKSLLTLKGTHQASSLLENFSWNSVPGKIHYLCPLPTQGLHWAPNYQ